MHWLLVPVILWILYITLLAPMLGVLLMVGFIYLYLKIGWWLNKPKSPIDRAPVEIRRAIYGSFQTVYYDVDRDLWKYTPPADWETSNHYKIVMPKGIDPRLMNIVCFKRLKQKNKTKDTVEKVSFNDYCESEIGNSSSSEPIKEKIIFEEEM